GDAGIRSVVSGLAAGKRVALANKESLVVAAPFIEKALRGGTGELVPVDSEHSAIFQCMQSSDLSSISGVTLTASGGPFLAYSAEQLSAVTPEQAVKHPRWSMGPKISVDSATLMNKALEVIEAAWLFGLKADNIEVVVHPQSIVHSFLDLHDGSRLAQLSVPDMKGAIGYALTYPARRQSGLMPPLQFAGDLRLDFIPLDNSRFPAIQLARACIRQGGTASAVLNITNEVAVEAFLNGKLAFNRIVPVVQQMVEQYSGPAFSSFEALLEFCAQLRTRLATSIIDRT
ncbi:MAG: 1-deoxy-D-xylulose-5-phosphate reductoisomerase, partial [Oligoflexia bacterium]|nr:1-deoxy-D-xylulose-5-phosphate reductoisomerase [Oligoflexia bacterium]